MNPAIPQGIAVVLPLLSAAIASWLSHDKLSNGVNALLALLFLLATALGCVALAGNFTGNWSDTVSLVLLYIGVLMQGQLQALQTFLVAAPSPLVSSAAPVPSAAVKQPELGG